MILDDGGDLTGIVHDKYPELTTSILVLVKKQQQVYMHFIKCLNKVNLKYQLLMLMIQ